MPTPLPATKILNLVNNALSSFWTIGIVGLVVGLYTGATWMGHLKNAVRTQWRPGFDLRPQKINIVIRTVVNLVLLLGFLLGMAVTLGLSSLSTSFANTVVNWLGFGDQPWIAPAAAGRLAGDRDWRRLADLHVSLHGPSGNP